MTEPLPVIYRVPVVSGDLTFSASEIGIECNRQLGYKVLKYPEERDAKTEKIFAEGHIHEKLALEDLREQGIKFDSSVLEGRQAELLVEVRLKGRPRFYVLAHPDGIYRGGRLGWKTIDDPSPGTPIEIKGLNHFTWRTIHSAKTIPPKYYAQIQMQILGGDTTAGVLVVRNKNTGEIKRIFVPRDQGFIKETLRRLGLLTTTIIEYQRIPQASWTPGSDKCKRCPFQAACLEDHGIKAKRDDGDLTKVESVPATLDIDDAEAVMVASDFYRLKQQLAQIEEEVDEKKTFLKNILKRFGAQKMVVGPFSGEITISQRKYPDSATVALLMDEEKIPFKVKEIETFNFKMRPKKELER